MMEEKIKLISLACDTSERIVNILLKSEKITQANKSVKACEKLFDLMTKK